MNHKNIYTQPDCIVKTIQPVRVLCQSTELSPWEEQFGTITWTNP